MHEASEEHAYAFTVEADLEDEARARAVEGALLPEIEGEELPRIASRIRRDGARIRLTVTASDASGLRAALNSYLRWFRAAAEVADFATGHPKG